MTSTHQGSSSEISKNEKDVEGMELGQSQDDMKAAKIDGEEAKDDEKCDPESGGVAIAEEHNYPGLLPAALLMLAICVATFLVSLVCPLFTTPLPFSASVLHAGKSWTATSASPASCYHNQMKSQGRLTLI